MGYRWATLALTALALTACSAAGQYVHTTGACDVKRTECDARCTRLDDPRDCAAACLLEARLCMRAQGDTGPKLTGPGPARISDQKAFLVDLFGARPKHSPELEVGLAGDVTPIEGAHRLGPGGRISVKFSLPAATREAEIVLDHAPEGDGTGCFVTITLGERTLAGRYAPPRSQDGAMVSETWNLTPQLSALSPEERAQPITLFVYNNDAAGSTAGYRLGSIQLFYRTLGAAPTEASPAAREITAPR